MGVALGDLLQISCFQEFLGEQMMNVFYYRYFSAPSVDNTIYEELADDFSDIVITAMRGIQVVQVEYTKLQVKNLSNGIDFHERDLDFTGTISATTDQLEPSFMALAWQLVRDSLVTRSGSKRVGGLIEGSIAGNEFVGSYTQIDPITAAFGANLHAGIIEVAAPVIVKRPIPVPAGSSYLYSSVTDVIFKGVSSQNTRKKGRGA